MTLGLCKSNSSLRRFSDCLSLVAHRDGACNCNVAYLCQSQRNGGICKRSKHIDGRAALRTVTAVGFGVVSELSGLVWRRSPVRSPTEHGGRALSKLKNVLDGLFRRRFVHQQSLAHTADDPIARETALLARDLPPLLFLPLVVAPFGNWRPALARCSGFRARGKPKQRPAAA